MAACENHTHELITTDLSSGDIKSTMATCFENVCLDESEVELTVGQPKETFYIINNQHECPLSIYCEIKDCRSTGKCSDIVFESYKYKEVEPMRKTVMPVRITARGSQNSEFYYRFTVTGYCESFNFKEVKDFTLKVVA